MKSHLFNRYAQLICQLFEITEAELFEKSKQQNLVDARHLLYYLCRKSDMRIRYIQEYLDKRGYKIGHSNIIYGIQMVQQKVATDSDYSIVINKIINQAHEDIV